MRQSVPPADAHAPEPDFDAGSLADADDVTDATDADGAADSGAAIVTPGCYVLTSSVDCPDWTSTPYWCHWPQGPAIGPDAAGCAGPLYLWDGGGVVAGQYCCR